MSFMDLFRQGDAADELLLLVERRVALHQHGTGFLTVGPKELVDK